MRALHTKRKKLQAVFLVVNDLTVKTPLGTRMQQPVKSDDSFKEFSSVLLRLAGNVSTTGSFPSVDSTSATRTHCSSTPCKMR
jgi:hypothetical protein